MMKQKTKKLTDAQSFFVILIFVLGGFTIIMLNILTPEPKQEEDELNNYNLSNVDGVAKDVVLNGNLFKEYSSGMLLYEGVVEGECDECYIFSYKFDAKHNLDLPLSVSEFRYEITIQNENIKLI